MKPHDAEKEKIPTRWIGCETEAHYFGEDRKLGKAQRKMASAKDRSRYKKTDQRQQAKQQKEFVNEEHLKRGRVLSIASQGIIVESDGELLTCTLKGSLKKDKTLSKNLVTVGDFVLFEPSGPGEGLIGHVEPRRTVLSRAENLSRRKEQLIAANIDQVIITVSVVSPPLKSSLVDRYIIATQKGGMEPVVVVNKIDLLNSNDPEIEMHKEFFQAFLSDYKAAGIRVIPISAETGEGIEELKKAMKDKASVFSGQSGVGKSSLINAVTGKNLRVGGIVEKTKKGTHTTTTAHLIPLEMGGWCIDTPGIKSFGVWDLDKEVIVHYFPEIFNCGAKCKYPDCSHMHEVGCAVMAAVEAGEISRIRFDSYQTLMHSVSQQHMKR
jgi:ribosome biogenesis GTPase / thiamine phosphate phosphatase